MLRDERQQLLHIRGQGVDAPHVPQVLLGVLGVLIFQSFNTSNVVVMLLLKLLHTPKQVCDLLRQQIRDRLEVGPLGIQRARPSTEKRDQRTEYRADEPHNGFDKHGGSPDARSLGRSHSQAQSCRYERDDRSDL